MPWLHRVAQEPSCLLKRIDILNRLWVPEGSNLLQFEQSVARKFKSVSLYGCFMQSEQRLQALYQHFSMLTYLELYMERQRNWNRNVQIELSFPRVTAGLAVLKHLRYLKLEMPGQSTISSRKEDHAQLHSVRWFKLQMWTAWHYQMERLHLDWVLPNAVRIAFRFDGKDCEDCEYRFDESTQNEREACKKERTQNITRALANSKAKLFISFELDD